MTACLFASLFCEDSEEWTSRHSFPFALPHLRNPDHWNYFFEECGVRLVDGRVKIKVALLKDPADHENDSLRRIAPKIEKFLCANGSFRPFKVWFEARDWELAPAGHFQKRLRVFQFVQVRDDIFNIRPTADGHPNNYYPIHGFFPGDKIELVVVLK